MIMRIAEAAPCVDCQDTGGFTQRGRTSPTRVNGRCSACNQQARYLAIHGIRRQPPRRAIVQALRDAREDAKAPSPEEIKAACKVERERRWSGLKPKPSLTIAQSRDLYNAAMKTVRAINAMTVDEIRQAAEAKS